MNKTLITIILACLISGILLVVLSKINPTILLVIGILAIVASAIMMVALLYRIYKKD